MCEYTIQSKKPQTKRVVRRVETQMMMVLMSVPGDQTTHLGEIIENKGKTIKPETDQRLLCL